MISALAVCFGDVVALRTFSNASLSCCSRDGVALHGEGEFELPVSNSAIVLVLHHAIKIIGGLILVILRLEEKYWPMYSGRDCPAIPPPRFGNPAWHH